MSVVMWIGVGLMAWCVTCVTVALIAGAILGRRNRRAAPSVPAPCLMCELDRIEKRASKDADKEVDR